MAGTSPAMTKTCPNGITDSIFKQPNCSHTRIHDPAARCARAVDLSLAPNEGVGNAGCPLHPRSRVHFVLVERTRVTTSTPESPGIPARNGFTAYVGLSPVTGLFCHRHLADIVLSKPGWADRTPQNLTPASGRQDHTILPSANSISRQHAGDRSRVFRLALQSHRAQNAAASTAAHPAFVTIMIRPSCGVGWREFVEMICPTGEVKYFCKEDWTAQIRLICFNKFRRARKRRRPG
jgi:hypothetical protein